MDSPSTRPSVAAALWRVAVAPVTFLVLSLLWCRDLAVGSILAYRADPAFWMKMDAVPFNQWLREVAPKTFPDSLWVYLLVALTYLVVASLVLCTLNWFFRRRRRGRGMGEVLVHLGFLLVFVGFVLGSGFGSRVQGIRVAEGSAAAVGDTGLRLRVDRVETVRGPGGRAWDTVSRVALVRGDQEVAAGTVRTNHPLIWGSTVVYPQGAQTRVLGATVATTRGTVRLAVGGAADLGGGRRLVLAAALDPGERRGPYFGPGVWVEHRDRAGQRLGAAFLTPGSRGLADLGGVRARLVDLDVTANGVFNVHHDPGIWWVLAGTVLLGLGTLWALAGYLGVRRLSAPEAEAAPAG